MNKIKEMSPKEFEEYAIATHVGRQIDESKSSDYCGSCSLEFHSAQLKNPSSWIHSSLKTWESLGGLNKPAMIDKSLFENIKVFDWKELDGKKLKISVSQDVDNKAKEMTTVVIGYEKKTGNMYTLHMETKRI